MTDADRRVSAALGWAILLALVLGGTAWLFFGWWIAGAASGAALWILWAAYVEDRQPSDTEPSDVTARAHSSSIGGGSGRHVSG